MFTTARFLAALAIIVGLLAPVCAPSLTFAALPSNERWRENLINYVVGFGKNTIGGKGGTLCTVTNLNDSGAGSLRACSTASGPQWIVFSLSGTITLSTNILMTSDKTVDGRGQNIVITGAGFMLSGISNIIIHNVTIHSTFNGADGVRMIGGTANVWIDHVTCYNPADECIDIGSAGGVTSDPATAITISWNRFQPPNGSGMLLVSDPSTPQNAATTVTLHHNYYNKTYVRHPFARWATMHSFNNYFLQNAIGVQISSAGKFYSENDIFECSTSCSSYPRVHADPFGPTGTGTGAETQAANVKVLNAWLVTGNETYQQRNPDTIFNPASYYTYTADTANATLRTTIINNAGRLDNPYPDPPLGPPTYLRHVRP